MRPKAHNITNDLKNYLIVIALFFLSCIPKSSYVSDDNTQFYNYCYTYGDNESLTDAKKTAKSLAIREAIESNAIYLESKKMLTNALLTKDVVETISAGIIESVEIVNESINDKKICYKIKAQINPQDVEKIINEKVKRYKNSTEKQDKITKEHQPIIVHIYQFGEMNYNTNILKYLLQTVNVSQKNNSFNFRLYDPFNLDDEQLNKAERNYDYVLNHMKHIYEKNSELLTINQLCVGLVPFRLYSNLFAAWNDYYSVITTYDWNFKAYKPPTVYEYIIHEILKVSIASSVRPVKPLNTAKIFYPIKMHDVGANFGCIFDYHYEKLSIRHQIIEPVICTKHTKQIVENFGSNVMSDIQFILSFKWLDNKIKDNLFKLYDFSFTHQ